MDKAKILLRASTLLLRLVKERQDEADRLLKMGEHGEAKLLNDESVLLLEAVEVVHDRVNDEMRRGHER